MIYLSYGPYGNLWWTFFSLFSHFAANYLKCLIQDGECCNGSGAKKNWWSKEWGWVEVQTVTVQPAVNGGPWLQVTVCQEIWRTLIIITDKQAEHWTELKTAAGLNEQWFSHLVREKTWQQKHKVMTTLWSELKEMIQISWWEICVEHIELF